MSPALRLAPPRPAPASCPSPIPPLFEPPPLTTRLAARPAARPVIDLKLLGFDDKSKIKVIKEVRAISGLGLKEAKDLVEGAPKVVKKDLAKADAEELIEKLKAVGAEVALE